jgi:hypothetical protein
MADQNTALGVSTEARTEEKGQTVVAPVVTPQAVSVDELNKIKTDYEAQLSQIKASQAGSDRIVAELKKQNEELAKKGMSDKERNEYEKKLFEQDRLNLEREKRELELKSIRSDFVAENAIDPEWREFLYADTKDGLKAQVDKIKTLIEKSTKPLQVELDKYKAGETRPGGGSGAATDKTMTRSEFEKLDVIKQGAAIRAGYKITD